MINLGWACYSFDRGEIYNLENWHYGVIHPQGKHLQHRWKDAYEKLRARLDPMPTHFAAEWPTFYNSQKGKIAAQENYTVNLAGIAAYLAGRLEVRPEYISLWTAGQWKGQVPKEITARKFHRLFGERTFRVSSSDVIDAIMIAQYWIDLYLGEKFSWQHRNDNIYGNR